MQTNQAEMPCVQRFEIETLAALYGTTQKREKSNQIGKLLLSNDLVQLERWALSELTAVLRSDLEATLRAHSGAGIQTVVLGKPGYPALLQHFDCAPLILFVRGSVDSLKAERMIALVGARKSTVGAESAASELAHYLALRGATIVSGLAYGIDAAAHRGAIASGRVGATIAVVAHGLDRVYPSAHRELAHQIVESGGAIISQFQLGVTALPHHFLIRNQVIAGISAGTFVIQAAERSGSLATARAALDAGREVLTLPGDFADQRFRGSNRLLRDGAHLISELQDLHAIFPWLENAADSGVQVDLELDPLVEYLKQQGETAIADIPATFGSFSQLSARLVELELDGQVQRRGANTYSAATRFG